MLEEKTTKKQNFLAGAAVLSLATMIVKVIGMFFKIPLNRLIGEANYGYFTTAYDIYTVLLMISTTGLPVAMSRMISEARALNNGTNIISIPVNRNNILLTVNLGLSVRIRSVVFWKIVKDVSGSVRIVVAFAVFRTGLFKLIR